MRRFVDLHLRQPDEEEYLETMLQFAADLGYNSVAVASSPSSIQKMGSPHGKFSVDLVSRVDLKPKSERELTEELGRVRRRFEVVAVECLSKAVARQAAKDHRVDILNFSPLLTTRQKVRFDREEARLASDANGAYEINISDLLGQEPTILSKLLSIIRQEIDNARKRDVPIVVSSGANSTTIMREPRGAVALLDLVGVDEEEGLDMVSLSPWGIVEENRRKLSPSFIAPGVRLVDWDAD